MLHILRFFALSLIIVLIVCQCARAPMTDVERSAIEDAVIAKHAEMLSAASKADADGLFSHFIENDRGALAFDGTLTLTREAALNGLREFYSGLQEQKFEMDEEYVNVISPETAVLTGTGKFISKTKEGGTFGGTFSVSIVFVLRESEWKVLHLHESLPNEPKAETVMSFDGVPIRYQIQGNGSPALVFVHGWSCDRSYWDEQVPYFAQKYKVVTIDLAGHGESGLDRTDWTMQAFGEDVVAVVEKLSVDQVILIGHSMGGPVNLEAARRMSNNVIGLVGVDTFNNIEFKRTQEQINEFMVPFKANFVEKTSNFVRDNMFTADSDSTLVEKIAQDMSSAPPEVGIGAAYAIFNYETNNGLIRAFQEVKMPIICINSDMNPTNVEAAKRYASSFEVVLMSDVGHFVQMEDPETFNRHLEKIVEDFVRISNS